ncbi:uncharacterized protein LOC134856147, partial [Symsagittifera roscoffensis]|uniref:uncharacterized protein LOC134856147 n=1 Tax=Symsagittifera roscoffensis TaxID=84072 RepID=UPI00307BDF2E
MTMTKDSSYEVFCTVGLIHARSLDNQETKFSFYLDKARVAPTNAVSIPLLELQAALLATRRQENIITIPISKVLMWTHSTTLFRQHLQWLYLLSKQLVTIVNKWRYVNTGNIPADT